MKNKTVLFPGSSHKMQFKISAGLGDNESINSNGGFLVDVEVSILFNLERISSFV